MPTTPQLPPLPEQVAHAHSNGEFCYDRTPPGIVLWPLDLYTASQLHARDRQIVELCASLCERFNVSYPMSGKPHLSEHTGVGTHAGMTYAEAIRALLGDKGGM